MRQQGRKRDHRGEPTYWFALLEIAREKGDAAQESEAIEQLIQLGVEVRYLRHRHKARQ